MGNIKIGFRLIAAFVVVAALAGVVGGFGYNGLHDTKQSLDNKRWSRKIGQPVKL